MFNHIRHELPELTQINEASGSAGTGKTYVATYLALQEVFAQRKNKIVFVRSAVPTRDIGFLKGDMAEKTLVYTTPFKQIGDDIS